MDELNGAAQQRRDGNRLNFGALLFFLRQPVIGQMILLAVD